MKNALRFLLCIIFITGSVYDSGAQVITTIAGNGSAGYTGNNTAATLASLYVPTMIAIDNDGNIYINDQGNSAIRKINSQSGIITTIAGDGTPGFSGDGTPATNAKFDLNWGIVIDGQNNIFITDQENYRVREINASGTINTIAGTGSAADNGDGGPATAAAAGTPLGIALDGAGNLFFCDQTNNVVRKTDATGTIRRVAGSGGTGYSGDGGPATLATFRNIFGLATDATGNLYICDAQNNCIRKVNTSGIISTVAGTGMPGYNGDNIAATSAWLYQPTGVYMDGMGNMYIADSYNNRIRKVNASGIITTIAGTGVPGFSGDNSAATAAKLDTPASVTMDTYGNVYIGDQGNERVREIFKNPVFTMGHSVNITACQNHAGYATPIDSILSVRDFNVGLTLTWSLISGPFHGTANISYSTTSTGGTVVPSGLFYTPALPYTGNDTLMVKVSDGADSNFIAVYVSVVPLLSFGGAITGPSYVCLESSITLADSTGAGTWSITNADATVSNGIITGQAPGKDTVEYTISNGCGSVTVSKPITVLPLPDISNITGASAICIGATAVYTNALQGGTWSSRSAHAAISPSGTVTAATAGADTIFYAVSDSFCMDSISFVIQIDTFPLASLFPMDTSVCAGAIIRMTDTPAGGNWAISNGNATDSQVVITTVSPGPDTISYSITNACGTAAALSYLTIDPPPAVPTINQEGSILSVPDTYSGYQWLFNGNPILGSTADTFLVTNTGEYSVYVRNQYGCFAVSPQILSDGCTPKDIVVYPNPTTSIVYVKWCKDVTIRVICDDGKNYEVANGINQADLSALPNADYLIVLYDMNGNKIKTEKISKAER